jgi:hypothetical protein
MKRKILGIFVVTLLIATTFCSAANIDYFSELEKRLDSRNIEHNDEKLNLDPKVTLFNDEEKICHVPIKYFVREGFTHNLSNITRMLNEIYEGTNITFDWNGTSITLRTADGWWNKPPGNILQDRKENTSNCTNGINVVFTPDTYPPLQGLGGVCYFDKCNGSRTHPKGGIILRDTCNETKMSRVLAHELLHGLGLSHEQIKWFNTSSGRNETKPIPSSVYNNAGVYLYDIPASLPVPPHGYGWYDSNGNCKLTPASGEYHPNGGWDIDGDCNFSRAEDKDILLWGRTDWTDYTITPEQRDYLYRNAKLTPGSRVEPVGEAVEEEETDTTSAATGDDHGDTEFDYIDILSLLLLLYLYKEYWPIFIPFLKLVMEVKAEIPEEQALFYDFYLDTDNDPDTGSPCGSEYLAAFTKSPEFTGAELYQYVGGDIVWQYIADVNWKISGTTMDYISEDDGGEEYGESYLIILDIPLELIELTLEGNMRIRAVATDVYNEAVDESPSLILSKEKENLPVLNLNPFQAEQGMQVQASGSYFTPNADVFIDFDWERVATAHTNSDGSFTAYFIVPEVEKGYYQVRACDENSKYHIRMFYVQSELNQPPSAPIIDGETNGKNGIEYEYTFNAVDPDDDNVRYHIDWDDSNSETTDFFSSGTDVKVKHTWDNEGTYTITAYAEDEFGLAGPEGTLTVTMPRNRAINTPFQWFLQQYPNMFPILRLLLLRY